MKRLLIMVIFLTGCSSEGICSTTYFSPLVRPEAVSQQQQQNTLSDYNDTQKVNIPRNVLSRLETKVLNQTFTQNSPQRRIERLEEQMFGATQSGNLDDRIKALQLASRTYNQNKNEETEGFSQPQTSTSGFGRGLLGTLGGFGGTMTGFTPTITTPTYSTYSSGLITPYTPYNRFNTFNPINRYNNYNPYNRYRYNRFLPPPPNGLQQGAQNGYGWSQGSQSFGSGTNVTILD